MTLRSLLRVPAPFAAALALAAMVGCAAHPRPTPHPSAGESLGGEFPAEGAVEPDDLAPGREGVEHWIAVEGLGPPEAFTIETIADRTLGASFATRTGDLEIAYWSRSDDGTLLLHGVDSLPDRARNAFDPPMVIAPARLGPQDPQSSAAKMLVTVLPDATRERARGGGTRETTYLRDEAIEEGGRPIRAKVVETRFTADLKTATVERTTELYVLPGEGVVARRWRERLVVLGLFPKDSTQTAVREGVRIGGGGEGTSSPSAPGVESRP